MALEKRAAMMFALSLYCILTLEKRKEGRLGCWE